MKVIAQNYRHNVVFTLEDGVLARYSVPREYIQNSVLRVFTLTKTEFIETRMMDVTASKRVILASDKGLWFAKAQVATHCSYLAEWFGYYPYGSCAIGVRLCHTTGMATVSNFETSINSQGYDESQLWERECEAYHP